MRTFMQWLEAKNIFWNGRQFQTKATPGAGYEHHVCDDCGRSFSKEWIDEFGPVCQCGGRLTQTAPEDLERSHDKWSNTLRMSQKPVLRGSGK